MRQGRLVRVRVSIDGHALEGHAPRPPTEGECFEFTDDDGDEYQTSKVLAVLSDGFFVTDAAMYQVEVLDALALAVTRRARSS